MPLIVWAYPRGAAIEAKGGKDSFYAVDYAARTASELGADVVKVNFPHPGEADRRARAVHGEFSCQEAIDAVVRSANRTLLLVSGGERAGDEAMLDKARQSMEAGATGLIFGRNVWQREHDESLRFVTRSKTSWPIPSGYQASDGEEHVMTAPQSAGPVVITRDGLDRLVEALIADGYRVIGPTVRDSAIVLGELDSAGALPAGWGVDTGPGYYRLRRRDDAAVFAHSAGPGSWKQFLHPAAADSCGPPARRGVPPG